MSEMGTGHARIRKASASIRNCSMAYSVSPILVMLIEDEKTDFDLVVRGLRRSGMDARCVRVDTEEESTGQAPPPAGRHPLDYVLPSFSALARLGMAEGHRPGYPTDCPYRNGERRDRGRIHETRSGGLPAEGSNGVAGSRGEAGHSRSGNCARRNGAPKPMPCGTVR